MRVLVVVSSRFTQQVLRRHLGFLAQEAVYCLSAGEALPRVAAQDFDLVCVEGQLTDGTGVDLARQLRTMARGAHVPVLLISGNADRKAAAEALAAGVTEIFAKTDIESLADHIARQEASELTAMQVRGHAVVVEDSRAVAAVFQRMLERLGMTSEVHPRAEDALAALSRQSADLVVTDVQLEGNMTGIGLVRGIRQLKGRAGRTPILAVSGLQDAARKVELLRLGANDYVSKPVLEEEFAARVRNMVHLARLLDEAEAQRDQLRTLALTDQLTGLYNRHYLTDIAARRIPDAVRHGLPVSLLILDLDHFKQINDSQGHDVGDVVLAEVGALLRNSCRPGEVAARTGGEEFVLVLINRDAGSAGNLADQLCAQLAALQPAGVTVTGSFGLASAPRGQPCDFKTLFKAADEAVYTAKAAGRNQVVTAASA